MNSYHLLRKSASVSSGLKAVGHGALDPLEVLIRLVSRNPNGKSNLMSKLRGPLGAAPQARLSGAQLGNVNPDHILRGVGSGAASGAVGAGVGQAVLHAFGGDQTKSAAGPAFAQGRQPTAMERTAMQPGAITAASLVGAGAGGVGGAAVGGLAGIGRAVFDKEDDGLRSLLRKVLGGAATGGLAGGTLGVIGGGGLAAINREAGNAKVEAMDDWRRIFREHKLRTADELTRSSEG